jgi:hypothetical protein
MAYVRPISPSSDEPSRDGGKPPWVRAATGFGSRRCPHQMATVSQRSGQ